MHCHLTARRSLVRFPAWGAVNTGGRFSPGLQCSGGLSFGPFCVQFSCSPRVHNGFPPLRTPTEKHAEEQNTLLTDRSLALVPGRHKGSPLLLGSWRKDSSGWENAEEGRGTPVLLIKPHILGSPGSCVATCVCVSPPKQPLYSLSVLTSALPDPLIGCSSGTAVPCSHAI